MEIIFGILFSTLSKVKIDFADKELIWKTYTIAKALPIIKKVWIINSKKFAKTVLDLKQEAFAVYVTTFFVEPMKMYLNRKFLIAALIINKALLIVLVEYLDFEDVFSKESAMVLLEYIKINIYTINLKEDKQPPYRPIYSSELIELKTLKT